MKLNAKAGRTLARSIAEARTLAAQARACARGPGARAKLAATRRLEELADRCQRVATQIQQRSQARSSPTGWCRWPTRRSPDPQGQARHAHPVRLCRPAGRGHRQHWPRRPRLSAAGGQCARQPGREPPAGPDRRRAGPPGASTTRGRPGRRLRARPDPAGAGRARTRQDVHRRAGRAGLPAHPPAAGPLPHWLRRAHQPLKRGYGLQRSRLRATRDSGSGPAGRSWPTTWTPRHPDRLTQAITTGGPPPATTHSDPTASRPPVSPGQVTRSASSARS